MLFIFVIMIAASVVTQVADTGADDGRDAYGFLEDVMSSKVRMSDMSEGDDTLVHLSDMTALSLVTGQDGALDYLEESLDAFCKGRPYQLELSFSAPSGDVLETSVGSASGTPDISAGLTVPVTTGGSLTAVLGLYS